MKHLWIHRLEINFYVSNFCPDLTAIEQNKKYTEYSSDWVECKGKSQRNLKQNARK